jgi:hypothetical protein
VHDAAGDFQRFGAFVRVRDRDAVAAAVADARADLRAVPRQVDDDLGETRRREPEQMVLDQRPAPGLEQGAAGPDRSFIEPAFRSGGSESDDR